MLFDKREERLQFIRSIYHFDDDRKVFRQPFDHEGVNDAGSGTELHEAAEDRGSCQSLSLGLSEDPFIERLFLVCVTLAYEDPQSGAFGGKLGHLQIT